MVFYWLLLTLLGLFTYVTVQRSAAKITHTPVWLLWLVMMLPAFIWTAYVITADENDPVPLIPLLVPFILSPILYWILVQWGRKSPPTPDMDPLTPSDSNRDESLSPIQTPIIRPIDKQEEAILRNCFPWTVYYLQNLDYRPQALICRGQLRSSPDVAYRTICENVAQKFGDRFVVIFQEDMHGKPFFALVPNPNLTQPEPDQTLTRPGLAIGLLIATVLTTTLAGAIWLTELDPETVEPDFALFVTGLPYGLALMAILGSHELGHYLAARYYRIKATLPYFIPVPPAPIFPFGTFGAFIQMRSPVPNRKALFDVGIAGPLSGFIVTLPLLIWGLAHSSVTEMTEESSLLNFDSINPGASLLLAFLSKLTLGGELAANQAIDLHPVAIAGFLGLIVTALNLMPLGQLDGGHIVHAMFGQRTGAMIGQITRFLVLFLALIQREFLVWAILLFFIPALDEPALNDVSELDNSRDFLGLASLVILVIIVLPAPNTLLEFLF